VGVGRDRTIKRAGERTCSRARERERDKRERGTQSERERERGKERESRDRTSEFAFAKRVRASECGGVRESARAHEKLILITEQSKENVRASNGRGQE